VGERLVIVGTVHVDPSSVSQARDVISSLRPSVVALELDEARLHALVDPSSTRNVGVVGRVASSGLSVLLMAVLEKFAGRLTGSAPGKEMVGAAEEAKRVGAAVALIDLPIDQTVGLLRTIPLVEKLKLVVDAVASLVVLPFGGGKEGLGEMAEDMIGHLGLFRRRYPELSRLLIDVREEYMATRVKNLLDGTVGVVVVVVGLGHMRSLAKRLEGYVESRDRDGFRVGASWTVGT
jgi:pheromone shutdown protein TraB